MLPALFAMLVILGLAIAVLAMVVLGMEGTGRHRLPEVSHTLARAGQHLNGDAPPPRGLIAFFDAAEDGADDLRHLPDTLRQLRSGSSARSARSAQSAGSVSAMTPASARTARSSATPARPDSFVPRPYPDQAPAPVAAWAPGSFRGPAGPGLPAPEPSAPRATPCRPAAPQPASAQAAPPQYAPPTAQPTPQPGAGRPKASPAANAWAVWAPDERA